MQKNKQKWTFMQRFNVFFDSSKLSDYLIINHTRIEYNAWKKFIDVLRIISSY